MKCDQCHGEHLTVREMVTLSDGEEYYFFCNRGCLRAWLGPDRREIGIPISGKKPDLSPQPVVVKPTILCGEHGESEPVCPVCLMIGAIFTLT